MIYNDLINVNIILLLLENIIDRFVRRCYKLGNKEFFVVFYLLRRNGRVRRLILYILYRN